MHRKWHGFTMIELLVVVVIVSLISTIAVPHVLSLFDSAEESDLATAVPFDIAPEVNAPDTQPARPIGTLPVLETVQIAVELQAREQRVGVGVVNRFRADVEGTLEVVPVAEAGSPTRIEVPFPESVSEIVEFSLLLQGRGRDGAPEPGELELRESGFSWVGDIAAAQGEQGPLHVRFGYTVRGEDSFAMHLPPARQLRDVDVTLHATGLSGASSSEDSLTPTMQQGDSLRWSFQNLVSGRPIEVVFPGGESPLGRAMRLFRLAGLAVLLFGAGFRYLGELYRPGRLDTFRWGHFLLLAATYSFFFVVLAALGYRGWTPAASLATSALLSLPLLAFHVATIFDLRFAWTRALPVAALTVLVVANGVYGGAWQLLVYLGVVFVVMAGLTLTYPVLHRRSERQSQEREGALAEQLEQLGEMARQAAGVCQQAETELEVDDPSCLERLREQLDQSRQALCGRLAEHDALLAEHAEKMRWAGVSARRWRYAAMSAATGVLEAALLRGSKELDAVLQRVRQGREKAMQQLVAREEHPLHCPSCGGHVGDARFCPGCGEEAPMMMRCRSCGQELRMPSQLLAKGVDPGHLHCMACGEYPRTQPVAVASVDEG